MNVRRKLLLLIFPLCVIACSPSEPVTEPKALEPTANRSQVAVEAAPPVEVQRPGPITAEWSRMLGDNPPMKNEFAMAYDQNQQKVITYGGRDKNFNNINET